MGNPFETQSMAAGYATSRPPVHPRVIERAHNRLGKAGMVHRALDVGCGAGISTQALEGFAEHCIGIEPAESMLCWTHVVAPHAEFLVGTAEALPLRARAVDLITAAGSLNYANSDLFFAEAARVLAPAGAIVIYDFQAGRTFRDSPALEEWFSIFAARYPRPPGEAREINPEVLSQLDSGFRVTSYEHFEIALTLTPEFYLNYMLTETNVAFALREGVSYEEIRSWCEDTLGPVWDGRDREVLFLGYFACMHVA